MTDRLTILGSGTTNLVPERAAASALIQYRQLRLVFDFGRGVSLRLVEHGLKQDDVEHAFISHFHPDHITDLLPYLHAASRSQIDRRTKDLNLYGPPGLTDVINRLFRVFGWSHELSRNFTVHVHEVTTGDITIGSEHLTVFDLGHSYGLRAGHMAVAGDADVDDRLVRCLSGAQLAVLDAGHPSDEQIIDLAVATQVPTLVCSHQYRPLDGPALQAAAAQRGYTGHIIVAHDLQTV